MSPVLPSIARGGEPHPLTKDHDPSVVLRWLGAVYQAVKSQRLSPPNAARVYAYFAVAAYEAVVGGMPQYRSLGLQLNDLPRLPRINQSRRYDWPLAANAAMGVIVTSLFDSTNAAGLHDLETTIRDERTEAANNGPVVDRSIAHGRAVGQELVSWIQRDGWTAIQGLAFTPPVGPGLWVRTPPNFGASIEPYWEGVRTFALDPVTVCAPVPPAPYSTDPTSTFYAEAMATHDAVLNLTDDQKSTAMFWRDNPDGSTGLPSGHWTLIAVGLVRQLNYNLAQAAEMLVLHGVAVADGFTSCWTEKYRTNLLRPVTYIQANIDPAWNSFVNSPAFPEYTSGHSVGSGAAATTLTALVGATGFTDDSGLANGFAARSFSSPWDAALEAATSRLYGGIHYPMAISAGLTQGTCVATAVLGRLRTRRGLAVEPR